MRYTVEFFKLSYILILLRTYCLHVRLNKMAGSLINFERIDLVYKTLNEVDFEVAVLLPKSLASSQLDFICPLAAHFHGGGLVTGTVLDPFFTAKW